MAEWVPVERDDPMVRDGLRGYYVFQGFDPRELPDPSPAFVRAASQIPELKFVTGFTVSSLGDQLRKQFAWEAETNGNGNGAHPD